MNFAPRWFAVLGIVALSFTRAFAADNGEDSGKDGSTQAAPADSKDTVTSSAKSDSDGKGTPSKDKGGADSDGHHAQKSDKGQKPGAAGKDAAVPAIDTTITVNQGRDTGKKILKDHLKDATKTKDKDPGSKDAALPGPKDKTAKNQQDTKPAEKLDRNAIGTKIDKDNKPADPRNANGLSTPPPTTANAVSKANPMPSAAGAAPAGHAAPVTGNGQSSGPNASTGPTVMTHPGSPVISGTGMVKPVVRTGMITGTPKPGAAVVSGNTVAGRHP